MDRYKVYIDHFQDATELIFIGSREDATEIYNYYKSQHRYDYHISVELAEYTEPLFSSLDEFIKLERDRNAWC